jgi:HAD superfamily hydrolase (TIGR01509 family)
MKAFIFDFDGVIVDSERHWRKLDGTMFSDIAPGYDEDHAAAMMGLNLEAGYAYLVRELDMTMPFAEYRALLERHIHAVYHALAKPLPGLEALLDRLDAANIPIAIASSSERAWIEPCLERLGLHKRFRSISTPSDVGGKAKPHPDVYLHAAAMLRTEPTACIAIEDSRNGILSATRAGMGCIAISTDMNRKQDLSVAHARVRSLDEVTMGLLGGLR